MIKSIFFQFTVLWLLFMVYFIGFKSGPVFLSGFLSFLFGSGILISVDVLAAAKKEWISA